MPLGPLNPFGLLGKRGQPPQPSGAATEVAPVEVTAPNPRWTRETTGDWIYNRNPFNSSDRHSGPPETFADFEKFVDDLQRTMPDGTGGVRPDGRRREVSVPFTQDAQRRPVVTQRFVGPLVREKDQKASVTAIGDSAHLHPFTPSASAADFEQLQNELRTDDSRLMIVRGKDGRMTIYGTAKGLEQKTPYGVGPGNRYSRVPASKGVEDWIPGAPNGRPTRIYGVEVRPPVASLGPGKPKTR
jgi:hypothetical protein